MNRLLEHLEVDRYFIVGTSYNGPTAFRAAARYPERVIGLVLGNPGGLPRISDPNQSQPRTNPLSGWLARYYRPQSYFDQALPALIPDPGKRGPDIAQQFHLMTTAKGRLQYVTEDAPDYLERITGPVLLQWTERGGNPRIEADKQRFEDFLSNATVETIEYPDAGQMLYQNSPEETAADVREFMDRVLAREAAAKIDP